MRYLAAVISVMLALAACGEDPAQAGPGGITPIEVAQDGGLGGLDGGADSGAVPDGGADAGAAPDAGPAPDATALPDVPVGLDSSGPTDVGAGGDAGGGTKTCKVDADCVWLGQGACTQPSCSFGLCVSAAASDGAACDDGNSCTGPDLCKAGVCAAAPKSCDDNNPCTTDGCDPASGCWSQPNASPCSDAAKCLAGTCADGKCKTGDQQGCEDANPCTVDKCVVGQGCSHVPVADGTGCGDGDVCKGLPMCLAGKCTPGSPADCKDGNPCTDDGCDPKAGCGWVANQAACDDGNACTTGDQCKGGKCQGGGAKACDDKNPCTVDVCDQKGGCAHTPTDGQACDDGQVCTTADKCAGGKCAGGAPKCDDKNPCTQDGCDPNSGACGWTPKAGPCDDGNACTSDDTCTNGKCVGKAGAGCDDGNVCTADSCDLASGKCVHAPTAEGKACDDGSLCTVNDACKAGKCAGGGAPACNDGNACTQDSCNAATGKCVFVPHNQGCDDGNACTTADTCSNGKCVAGTQKACDDGNVCTADGCDPKTGACKAAATGDGQPCNDGQACTSGDTCKAGQCVPTKNDCAIYKHDFSCGNSAGWSLQNISNNAVKWAVDETPAVALLKPLGCTLNLNDGKDYCDTTQGKYCKVPGAVAISPVIDASKVQTALILRYKTYYDLDGPPGEGNPAYDRPQIQVLDAASNQVLQTIALSKELNGCAGSTCQKKLLSNEHTLTSAAGKKIRLRLSLIQPTDYLNIGAGWFIDQFELVAKPPAENCTDKIDNDFDGKTDCADPDCAGSVDCVDALFKTSFPCDDQSFAFEGAGKNKVAWAVDATPASPKAHSGACSLNFNNGQNYCGVSNCQGNSSATGGTATTKQAIATAGSKKLTLSLWSNTHTENAANFDRAWVQVSADGFKGCLGGDSSSCTGTSNCNTEGTASFQLPKGSQVHQKWVSLSYDVSKFAGKAIQIRFRFASCDGVNNGTQGWFIDDVLLTGQ